MSRLDGEKHREPETSKQASDNSIFGGASQPVDIRGMQHRALASGKHTRAANRIRSPGLTFSHNLPEITIPRSRILMVARRSWFNYGRSGWALKEFQPSSLSYFSYFSFFFLVSFVHDCRYVNTKIVICEKSRLLKNTQTMEYGRDERGVENVRRMEKSDDCFKL